MATAQMQSVVRQLIERGTCPLCAPTQVIPMAPLSLTYIPSSITCVNCLADWSTSTDIIGPDLVTGRPADQWSAPKHAEAQKSLYDLKYGSPRTKSTASPVYVPIQDAIAEARAVFSRHPVQEKRAGDLDVRSLVEIGRQEEAIGHEDYKFDNRRSSSTSVESILVSNRYRLQIDTDTNKANITDTTGTVKLIGVVDLAKKASEEVRRRYAIIGEQELKHEQTTSVNVPARTFVRCRILWKRVWAHGNVSFGESTAGLEIPFRATISLRFDKQTEDIA